MVQTELLKLDAREKIYIGNVTFEFLEFEIDERFCNHLVFIDAQNPGTLPKLANSPTPAGPNAQF